MVLFLYPPISKIIKINRFLIVIILITGPSHTGKTLLAQNLLEKYQYPYLSIDLLKMGLIRSKNTHLTPMDDQELIKYLWPIVKEIIKTTIENKQNLIIEGAYIPFDWKKDFQDEYLSEILYYCLVMSQEYIYRHFADIKKYAHIIERRTDDSYCTLESLQKENEYALSMCKKYDCPYILIDKEYEVHID